MYPHKLKKGQILINKRSPVENECVFLILNISDDGIRVDVLDLKSKHESTLHCGYLLVHYIIVGEEDEKIES